MDALITAGALSPEKVHRELHPKAKYLFYGKTLLSRGFFSTLLETLLVLSFFLGSAKFREITSKSSFLQVEQAFLQN